MQVLGEHVDGDDERRLENEEQPSERCSAIEVCSDETAYILMEYVATLDGSVPVLESVVVLVFVLLEPVFVLLVPVFVLLVPVFVLLVPVFVLLVPVFVCTSYCLRCVCPGLCFLSIRMSIRTFIRIQIQVQVGNGVSVS